MILLVEDDDEARMALRRALEWHGHEVLPTRDAAEAEARFRDRGSAIDLLVADVVLPDRSGVELAASLVRLRRGLRVLFLSGYDRRELSLEVEGMGPSAFVEKPVTIRRLGDEVRRLLETPVSPRPGEGGESPARPESRYPARREMGWP